MKHCKDCDFSHKEPVQMGPQGLQMTYICKHEECSDPVTGDPLPAQIVRGNPAFCGLNGKYFKLKEQKPDTPVIKLA